MITSTVMIITLPSEILVEVLSHLSIPDLANIQACSSYLRSFFLLHETQIFRNAAVFHGFARYSNKNLKELYNPTEPFTSNRPLLGLKESNWKIYCRRMLESERGWAGKATPTMTYHSISGTFVHRIKVDEARELLITSEMIGGIRVVDLETNNLLWGLGRDFINPYVHCEYDNGYLVFNRDEFKEVWRLESDCFDESPSVISPPDRLQHFAASNAQPSRVPNSGNRGKFVPWALIPMPDWDASCFRLVFPTLVVVSNQNARLWDVRTGESTQSILDIQRKHGAQTLGSVNYVEVDNTRVIICGSRELRVFSRTDGRILWSVTSNHSHWSRWPQKFLVWPEGRPAHPEALVAHEIRSGDPTPPSLVLTKFIAAHVSRDGNYLVALTNDERLFVFRNFHQLTNRKNQAGINVLIVKLSKNPENIVTNSSHYLSLEHSRVGVATKSGIFVISLNDKASSHANTGGDWPMTVSRAALFDDKNCLGRLSCLQITNIRMYFVWNPDITSLSGREVCTLPSSLLSGVRDNVGCDRIGMRENEPVTLLEEEEIDDWDDEWDDDDGFEFEDWAHLRKTVCSVDVLHPELIRSLQEIGDSSI